LARVLRGDSLAGGAENDEGVKLFGCPEGIHSQAGRGWGAGRLYLPQGRHQPDDLFQLEEVLRWTEMRRPKQFEDENGKLKKLVAELSLDREMLQDVIRQKCMVRPAHARSLDMMTMAVA
jgi:hypothetical protein